MSNELNFPVKYRYTRMTPGDYVVGKIYTANSMYRYAKNTVIKNLVDLSEIEDMSYMFANSSARYIIPFDTSSATNMSYMFSGTALTHIPYLDTKNVTKMDNMFSSCGSLITIPQLDMSKVKEVGNMFYSCSKLESIPLLDWGSVTSMNNLFGYSSINSITDLGGFKDLGKQSNVSGASSGFLERVPNLTHESLMNVINNLYDRKSNGLSNSYIKFGTTNLNKLTDEEKAIVTNKGWNLS